MRDREIERKEKTYCTVEIAQVKRESSVVSEGLISVTFANLSCTQLKSFRKSQSANLPVPNTEALDHPSEPGIGRSDGPEFLPKQNGG